MRRGNNPKFVFNSKLELMGIDLSSDFCAEHEWGIKKIKAAFDIDSTAAPGIARRKINKLPWEDTQRKFISSPVIKLLNISDKTILTYDSFYGEEPTFDKKWLKGYYNGELVLFDEHECSAAWDEKSFAMVSRAEHEPKLREIYDAIMAKNVVIGLFGGQVFKNAGLMILIADRIDQSILNSWEKGDTDSDNLHKASEETGIKQKIDAANIDKDYFERKWGYYALSPAWAKNKKTKYRVMYWLNPQHQDINNFGWYSVEELEQWLENRGPVVAKRK